MLCFDEKKIYEMLKTRWVLYNILEIHTFQRIAKVYLCGLFLRNRLHERGIVILVKVGDMYNILKSASHCLLVKIRRWNWMIKCFAGVCP